MESLWFCQQAEVFDSVGEFAKQGFGNATSESVQTSFFLFCFFFLAFFAHVFKNAHTRAHTHTESL